MSKDVLLKHRENGILVYFIRSILAVFIILLLINFKVNPMGFSILLLLFIVMVFLSSIQEISIYSEFVEFKSNRLLPIFSKRHIIGYNDILKVKLYKRKVSYFILVMPGVGAISDNSLVFHLKNGNTIEKTIRGKTNSVEQFYDTLNLAINSKI